jgi:glycerate-2-kinase
LLRAIAVDAVAACDPALAVERAVRLGAGRLVVCDRPVLLDRKGRLIVVALGKAAPRMVEGLMARVGQAGTKRVLRGLVVSPRDGLPSRPAQAPAGLARVHGEHPIPGRTSFAAARKALGLLARAGERDDVIFLVSGGGSALLASPLAPFLNTAQKAGLHRVLIASGAPIGSINTVRKHLSAVKGGRLAVAARRARSQTTLVVCDVDPGRYEEVASGPSLADRSTLEDMVAIIDRYGLAPAFPVRILEALRAGRLPETPKPGDRVFRRSRSQMILSNRDLRNAAVRTGLSGGLSAEAHPSEITGPVEEAVEAVARAIEAAPPGTRLLVRGGEVLVVPSGPGVGGRAQEFALRLAMRMSGLPARPWAFLACGSDGKDGNSPAAGAFADSSTLDRALSARLDPAKALRDSQTYRFFKRLGDDVTLPPTGTNVRDLYLLLTGDPRAAARAAGSSGPNSILV